MTDTAALFARIAQRTLKTRQRDPDAPRWGDRNDPRGDEVETQERADRRREKGE